MIIIGNGKRLGALSSEGRFEVIVANVDEELSFYHFFTHIVNEILSQTTYNGLITATGDIHSEYSTDF